MCPLLVAINKNNVPLAKLCMKYPKCDLNIANYYGKTPLLLAIENGNIEILSALLQDYGDRRVKVESNVRFPCDNQITNYYATCMHGRWRVDLAQLFMLLWRKET